METISLTVDKRERLGKKTRALRTAGLVPINVYGLPSASVALQAKLAEIVPVIREAGETGCVNIAYQQDDGREAIESCLVRDVVLHPVTDRLVHVSFQRVEPDKLVKVNVPIRLVNKSKAPVTLRAGISIMLVVSRIKMRVKAGDIPRVIEADCAGLAQQSDTIRVSDLPLPKGSQLLSNPDLKIISIQVTRAARASQDAGSAAPAAKPAGAAAGS